MKYTNSRMKYINPQVLARLQRLEARMTPSEPPPKLRYGYLTPLPDDYVGERHIVTISRKEEGPHSECCEFEERPGPGPAQNIERGLTVYYLRETGE